MLSQTSQIKTIYKWASWKTEHISKCAYLILFETLPPGDTDSTFPLVQI